MSYANPYIDVAALDRVADLVQDGAPIEQALRITANEVLEYYEQHIGERVESFDLTSWVLNGKKKDVDP